MNNRIGEKMERLKTWGKGVPVNPFKIEFWPTQKCNLNCKYCREISHSLTSSSELSDSKILELVDESADLEVKEWVIAGGGEPLVRKKIVLKMMEKIKKKGMFGSMTTNGTLLDKDSIRSIIDMKWDVIFFSLDGHTPQTNDYLRKKGAFKKAYKNLLLFKKLKKDKEPLIGFSSVLTNTNYAYLKGMIELAYEVGCENIIFNPIKGNNTNFNEKFKLNIKQISELRENLPFLKKVAEKLGVTTTLDTLNTELVERSSDIKLEKKTNTSYTNKRLHLCFEPWTSMLITSEGNVGPCCERPSDTERENIKNNGLKEVWYGRYFQAIRQCMLDDETPEICSICNSWKITDTKNTESFLEWSYK